MSAFNAATATSGTALLTDKAARRSLVEALGDFARLSRASDAMDAQGFSRLQVAILNRLARHGSVRLTDLAADLGADLSVISRQAAHLTEHGFLARLRDPSDRRAFIITITQDGLEVVDEVRRRRDDWLSRTLAHWDEGQVAEAATIVRTVVSAIQATQT